MAQLLIPIVAANSGGGGTLQATSVLLNSNFTELYTDVATRQTAAQVRALRPETVNVAAGRAIAAGDYGKTLRYTGASAANFPLPNDLGADFIVALRQSSTGKATFTVGAGTPVLVSPDSEFATASQHSTITAHYEAGIQWVIDGRTGA